MKSLTFRWKLTLFIVLICGVSLSLAFAGLYLYDIQQSNLEMQRRVDTSRRLLVDALTPLLMQNPGAVELPANLVEADGQIAAAAVFSKERWITAFCRATR